MSRADVFVQDDGSMVVLHCQTQAAQEWADESLPPDTPKMGRFAYAIERAYVGNVIAGMVGDGLTVR